MRQRVGNQLRESTAQPDQIADNFPDLFPVEEWRAYYWTMDREGKLAEGRALMRLPEGIAAVTRELRSGETGLIESIRRWGVTLRGEMLEAIGFDLSLLLSHDRSRFASDDAELLHLATDLTHFDLPGFFILASQEHPFLLFDPQGVLKGRYTDWYTYAGALAYLVTDGRLATSFGLTWEKDRSLYEKVIRTLNEMLAEKQRH